MYRSPRRTRIRRILCGLIGHGYDDPGWIGDGDREVAIRRCVYCGETAVFERVK